MPLQIVTPTPPDIEIAQAVTCRPITEIAAKIGLADNDYEPHGHDKAKVRGSDRHALERFSLE
jgi:formyltetrahydrofolate synthetase